MRARSHESILRKSPGDFAGVCGGSREGLGSVSGFLLGDLGESWDVLGVSCCLLGCSWVVFVRFLGRLGDLLLPLGVLLGDLWDVFGFLLGARRGLLVPLWELLGGLGRSLGTLGGVLGA